MLVSISELASQQTQSAMPSSPTPSSFLLPSAETHLPHVLRASPPHQLLGLAPSLMFSLFPVTSTFPSLFAWVLLLFLSSPCTQLLRKLPLLLAQPFTLTTYFPTTTTFCWFCLFKHSQIPPLQFSWQCPSFEFWTHVTQLTAAASSVVTLSWHPALPSAARAGASLK